MRFAVAVSLEGCGWELETWEVELELELEWEVNRGGSDAILCRLEVDNPARISDTRPGGCGIATEREKDLA